MEVQGVLRLRPVHPVLHEQQARPEPRLRALRDGTLPAVSTALSLPPQQQLILI